MGRARKCARENLARANGYKIKKKKLFSIYGVSISFKVAKIELFEVSESAFFFLAKKKKKQSWQLSKPSFKINQTTQKKWLFCLYKALQRQNSHFSE